MKVEARNPGRVAHDRPMQRDESEQGNTHDSTIDESAIERSKPTTASQLPRHGEDLGCKYDPGPVVSGPARIPKKWSKCWHRSMTKAGTGVCRQPYDNGWGK